MSASTRRQGRRPNRRPALLTSGIRYLVATLLVCGLAVTPDAAEAHQPSSVGDGQITPLFDAVLSPPRWFTGSDGQVYLVYEL